MFDAAHSTMSTSAPVFHGLLQGLARHPPRLGHQRELIVGTLPQSAGACAGVEHTGFLHHIAALNAGGLLDELDAGVLQRCTRAPDSMSAAWRALSRST